ncbi:hypothetical protein L873DRAFT_1827113 [Choiromyces venosus 120613-1]|uniref:RWD domain-containing protein n=1 Tax=Choiromyces venosus 120613-1 TaxID=1336337 RepID=A0A3N4JXT9_9PEZI|nr:hypothetical protein L873DRAFT_1827113 [Choiromyces venosus 120613-1]
MSTPKPSSPKGESPSAFNSPTFTLDMSIKVDAPVGSMYVFYGAGSYGGGWGQVGFGLHIVDLDNPYDPPRFLPHLTAWSVADVQWSPHASHSHWVVSTSNQKAIVWNLVLPSRKAIEHVLHSHTRAITDINFSAHQPNTLATCSIDSFVHCWDLRTPRRPVMSFCDWFAGATQVKFNRQNEHILASSHDKYLYIWDMRMGAHEIRKISAHSTKIYGLDWNRTRPSGIVTCALDKTVKFWNYEQSPQDTPERVINTSFPVWRARHTPFGRGILTMPQRGDTSLYLWDRRMKADHIDTPVAMFEGHTDHVKEFLWRWRGGESEDGLDDREFQLVSWGLDKDIRLWSIDKEIMERVGHDPKKKMRFRVTRRGAQYKTYRDEAAIVKESGTASKEGGFMRAGRKRRKEINPITWMKGVKIGRRIPGSGGESEGSRNSTRGSGLFGIGWDGPETLGDEISLVGVKFPKINFEKVNIAARTCTVSLTGPWGTENKWVFLRADITFPPDYPGDAKSLPVFTLERTNSIPDSNLEVIDANLKKIAEVHVGKTRVCLEPCLCYLLGERAENAAWVGSEDEGRSSSDDDDGVVGLGIRSTEEEEGVGGLPEINNQASVPLPRVCGATWANDGRLVCFFPPKEERPGPRSLLSSLAVRDGERMRQSSGRLWECFGRLYTSTTGPRRRGHWLSEADGDTSENSYSTSSNSSSDESDDSISGGPLRPTLGWRLHGNIGKGFRRGGSTDRSTQRSTGTGVKTITGFNSTKPKNVVSIHDFSYLLPAKRELAVEYKVSGEGPEICRHNANVAEKYGYIDMADVWRLIEMVLCNEVPLEICGDPENSENEDNDGLKDKMTAITNVGTKEDPINVAYWGEIKWGAHPLGGRWLVEDLFNYFQRKADVQMLAMLSCIFCEADPADEFEGGPKLPFEDVPLPGKVTAYTLEYFSTLELARQTQSMMSVSPQHHSASMTPMTHGSFGSSNGGGFNSDPSMPYSTGTTPPLRNYGLDVDGFSSFPSLSSSPEQTHHYRKSTAGMAANFSAGLVRAFGPGTGSPPTRKRPSPAESLMGNFTNATSGVTWGPITTFGSGSKGPPSEDLTETNSDHEHPSSARITMMNLDKFDDEGNVNIPFLDPKKTKLYRSYRENYADILYVWCLQIQRLEVLQFNGLKCNQVDEEGELVGFGRKRGNTDGWDGLEIAGHCSKCGAVLDVTKGARGECKACKRRQVTMTCCICDVIIKGLYGPCLQCGHVAHADCHEAWFSQEGIVECPTGCGCNCMHFVENGFKFERVVPVPPVNIRPPREERPRRPMMRHDYML